ncbi:hypothetical protein [Bradyrhizobium sp. RP6]|uniref:hypothetical protein n=1 Tax=Bradyrhizobium sp. RP6 TaxID=2489596 RepID=UPI000F535BFF|nr:hypothetical protein [Bradyrhizobium sp. RP6]RQH13604.1 hypothetical protein EHH60_11895 [Bradyrhizobium sp. RP6]
MTNAKRGRGRPKGSGKNDGPILDRVADAIVKDPQLKPTTAMLRIIRGQSGWDATEATLLRRLQGKWKNESEKLLNAARERAARVNFPTRPVATSDRWPPISDFERHQRWLDSAVGKAAMGYVTSSAFQKVVEQVTSPSYQAELSRVEKLARGLLDDGSLTKRISEMHKLSDKIFGLDKWQRGF